MVTLRMYLTFEEMMAGVPCRACGPQIIDGRGTWPGLFERSQEDVYAHEAATAAFITAHSDCHEGSCTVQGSRTMHCVLCCPPPPMSPQVSRDLAAAFRTVREPVSDELDWWELLLTCD
ncbi:hypothetical protein [Plantibacter sp. lyk4-40-MEA-4]|uniref:hypothetical protein n=1 Tax=Plantibacter sp. lyk4-40-MEA-4 TaxID=3040298 RepID=UPI00254D7739|nr:hypothetical protein [Plantibacter sp. lyk4-40-MEA-4]